MVVELVDVKLELILFIVPAIFLLIIVWILVVVIIVVRMVVLVFLVVFIGLLLLQVLVGFFILRCVFSPLLLVGMELMLLLRDVLVGGVGILLLGG